MIDRMQCSEARTRALGAARVLAFGVVAVGVAIGVPACATVPAPSPSPSPPSTIPSTATIAPTPSVTADQTSSSAVPEASAYPWHTDIVATTFWVGEIFDPDAEDGSQEISTYDSNWLATYGGCDGVVVNGECHTEARSAANGWFPTAMTPLQNPFYLDVPFDDINDPAAFARRDEVVPWAAESPYVDHRGDDSFSYLKNRWVQLRLGDRECYGQIEDAGPGEYNDAAYVFGRDDARPANTRYGGAGLDVSPALTGCLGFTDLDGITGGVSWRFVEEADVPVGPWLTIVTTSQVS